METTATQSKANTWMRKREQEFIARGWKVSYGTGGSAIISPNLCKKMKEGLDKTNPQEKNEK